MVVFNVVDVGEAFEVLVVTAFVDRVVDLLVTVSDFWTVGVVGGIGVLFDKLGKGVEVDVVFGVVDMLLVVGDALNENKLFVGTVSVVYLGDIPGTVVSAIKY